jgi:hypothetical protein
MGSCDWHESTVLGTARPIASLLRFRGGIGACGQDAHCYVMADAGEDEVEDVGVVAEEFPGDVDAAGELVDVAVGTVEVLPVGGQGIGLEGEQVGADLQLNVGGLVEDVLFEAAIDLEHTGHWADGS